MADDNIFRARCPLGVKLHLHLGTLQPDQWTGHPHEGEAWEQWKREKAQANFDKFRHLVNTEKSQENKLTDSLSFSQRSAWRLLEEWLEGTYQPPGSVNAAIDAIRDKNFIPGDWPQVSYDFHAQDARPNRAHYAFHMFELYVAEFVPFAPSWDQGLAISDFLLTLERYRETALKYSTCQKMAHSLYLHHLSHQETASQTEVIPPPPLLMTCPWLDTKKLSHVRPYYLFDTQEKRTVRTQSLEADPVYCCISHTWGRWKTGKNIRVKGVTEWKIPSNTVFEVRSLPQIISDFAGKLRIRYVWFDLLCIPQEGLTSELEKRKRVEIAQQAGIFCNARTCVIWFNYIDNWQADRSMLDYMSLTYLILATLPGQYEHKEIDGHLRAAENGAQSPSSLCDHPHHERYTALNSRSNYDKLKTLFRSPGNKSSDKAVRRKNWHDENAWDETSVWFSSLWTLQEACLRPDMLLMNRRWEALTDSAGNLYSLEMLIFSIEVFGRLTKEKLTEVNYQQPNETTAPKYIPLDRVTKHGVEPMGMAQLNNLLVESQLTSAPSRASILIRGNSRKCTAFRAEAIMSALDLTNWQPRADEPSVLDMYPLSFVNAAREKLGPEFFLANKFVGDPEAADAYYGETVSGSMLPFTELDPDRLCGKGDIKKYLYQPFDERFHASVASWMMDEKGAFHIRQAAILASSQLGSKGHCLVEVNLSYQTYHKVFHEVQVDIQHWLQRQPKQFVTFAVNISKDIGLLLQGHRHHVDLAMYPLKLVKIGCYQVIDTIRGSLESIPDVDWITSRAVDWVPSQDVDWVVL